MLTCNPSEMVTYMKVGEYRVLEINHTTADLAQEVAKVHNAYPRFAPALGLQQQIFLTNL